MTNDRKRRNASGWTPRDLGLSTAALGIATLAGGVIDKLGGGRRGDRYPRPVQGNAERRRRLRQQQRRARTPNVEHANA